jgi:PAS domain S-box-containing protein
LKTLLDASIGKGAELLKNCLVENSNDSTPKSLEGSASATLQRDREQTLSILPSLMVQMLRYQAVIDNISQGVCFFDGEQRLVLSNPRYAEIYYLEPEHLVPGTTLREIIERRATMGTCPLGTADEYAEWCTSAATSRRLEVWNAKLTDGRIIRVCHQPMEDGGWIATHEDISDKVANTALANERLSLQQLIDTVPDYLWVKGVDSRFVIANEALAADWGRTPAEMIGLIDTDYHPPEVAKYFRDCELEILRTEEPMIDREEHVLDPSGRPKWILSSKMLLRGRDNEVLGFVGIARDITERKL